MGEARCILGARSKNRSTFFFSRQSALAQTHFHPKKGTKMIVRIVCEMLMIHTPKQIIGDNLFSQQPG